MSESGPHGYLVSVVVLGWNKKEKNVEHLVHVVVLQRKNKQSRPTKGSKRKNK